jgi:hypothetical protein
MASVTESTTKGLRTRPVSLPMYTEARRRRERGCEQGIALLL